MTFPEIDPRFEFRRPSVARDVVLRGVRPRTPLYVTPYVLTGASRRALAGAAPGSTLGFRNESTTSNEVGTRRPLSAVGESHARPDREHRLRAGGSGRSAGQSRSLSAVLPGAAALLSGGQRHLRLHVGRRTPAVQLTPHRTGVGSTPVPVAGGARLVGRVGGWDVGMLEMQTQRQSAAPSRELWRAASAPSGAQSVVDGRR